MWVIFTTVFCEIQITISQTELLLHVSHFMVTLHFLQESDRDLVSEKKYDHHEVKKNKQTNQKTQNHTNIIARQRQRG